MTHKEIKRIAHEYAEDRLKSERESDMFDYRLEVMTKFYEDEMILSLEFLLRNYRIVHKRDTKKSRFTFISINIGKTRNY